MIIITCGLIITSISHGVFLFYVEWLQHRASLSSNLSGLILNVIELINKSEYTPKSPRGDEIDNVYDLRFQHVQPYLHKVSSFMIRCMDT